MNIRLFGFGARSTSTFWPSLNDNLSFNSEEIPISSFLTSLFAVSTIVETPFGFFEKVLIEILPFVLTPIMSAEEKLKEMRKIQAKNKKGLSPIIVTMILIGLTIGISSVLFLWFRGMVEEGVTKFGKNIQLVCDDVDFEASYSNGRVSIINNGNIPLFKLNVRISKGGSYQTRELNDILSTEVWPEQGLQQGGAFSGDISGYVGGADKITLIPILIGASSKGKKTFECDEKYGKEITV